MKFNIVLFSTYLLLLCTTPCILQPLTEKKDICCNTNSSSKDQKDHSKENHGCNPLRACSCSQSFGADVPNFLLSELQSVIFLKIFTKPSLHSFFVTPIWQPPKIS